MQFFKLYQIMNYARFIFAVLQAACCCARWKHEL